MRTLIRTVALLCTLLVVAAAPTVAAEPSSSSQPTDSGVTLDIWEWIQTVFESIIEAVVDPDEGSGLPNEEPGEPPEIQGDEDDSGPAAEQFPFPDPNG